jgi:ankyrin repeat protein
LHYEKDIEQLEEAKNLIALGADVNEVRAREALILHAIKKKSLEFVKFLLSKGADRHIRNRGNLFNAFYGETPLDIAERLGHNEIIKILLEQ